MSEVDVQASPPARRRGLLLGVLLGAAALGLNRWALEENLSPDGHFQSARVVSVIVAVQVVLAAAGLWCLLRRPFRRTGLAARGLRGLATLGFGLLAVVAGYANLALLGVASETREYRAAWQTMMESEGVILSMTPRLKTLARAAMNLQVPDEASRDLFEDRVTVVDVAADVHVAEVLEGPGVEISGWSVSTEPVTVPREQLALWQPMVDAVDAFSNTKFYFIRGRFLDAEEREYEAVVAFKALARMKTERMAWIKGLSTVTWGKVDASRESQTSGWRIRSWKTERLEAYAADRLLFAETLDAILPDPEDRARARASLHEGYVAKLLTDPGFEPPHPRFQATATDTHPGLAVVDVDRDGHDDLYVTERWGKAMFFRNRGDGTFEEIAAELGLDVEGHTNAALFADLDNDGDPDAFLGRSYERSQYLVNEGGRFVDRSAELVDAALPYFGTSVAAADYNLDGLLDVYVSTYAAAQAGDEHEQQAYTSLGGSSRKLLADQLPERDARELYERFGRSDAHVVLALPGPPNVLLENRGDGRFHVVEDTPLRVFSNTYQSTWADYDGDGDPDVYLANDYSANNLFRNDGGGRFTDVTAETGTADIGFGMGASWGDYDGDGRQDLYVSNMFSKAGRRITAQLPYVDPRFVQASAGNSLFHNEGAAFRKVSGTEEPKMLVEEAEWSWASQFVDLDNDGWLDIHAPCGHYTAPREVRADVDL
jgi:hypothetical protein